MSRLTHATHDLAAAVPGVSGRTARPTRPARAMAAMCRAAVPLAIAAAISPAPSAAWAQQGFPKVPGFPAPALEPDPPYPVLPGLVGPSVDPTGVAGPDAVPPGGASHQRVVGADVLVRPVVPPAPLTWDRATEESAAATGTRHGVAAGDRVGRRWGVAIALVATLGLVVTAVLAAIRHAGRSTLQLPISILRDDPTGTHR